MSSAFMTIWQVDCATSYRVSAVTENCRIQRIEAATILCPRCGQSKTLDVSKYVGAGKAVRLKCHCPCGHDFRVFLERRGWPRKKTFLPGVLTRFDKGRAVKTWALVVENLSRSGLKIRLVVDNKDALKVGDRAVVRFLLDDNSRALAIKDVVIRRIDDIRFGAEFVAADPSDEAVGFFTCRVEDKPYPA